MVRWRSCVGVAPTLYPLTPIHKNESTNAGAPGLRWCTRAVCSSFGVVRPRDIKYRVHMCPSFDDPLLFRLNTDVWEYM